MAEYTMICSLSRQYSEKFGLYNDIHQLKIVSSNKKDRQVDVTLLYATLTNIKRIALLIDIGISSKS